MTDEIWRENEIFYAYPNIYQVEHALSQAKTRRPNKKGWMMLISDPDCDNEIGASFLWFNSQKQMLELLKLCPLLAHSAVNDLEIQKLFEQSLKMVVDATTKLQHGELTADSARIRLNKVLAAVESEILWWGETRTLGKSQHWLIQPLRARFREEAAEYYFEEGVRPTPDEFLDAFLEYLSCTE